MLHHTDVDIINPMRKNIAEFWRIFKTTPLGKLVRFLSPQWLVNLLEHFPAAFLANIVYGFPSRKISVIGVTGTDGKTTTSNMIYQILEDAGKSVALVSTINAKIGGEEIDTGFHVTSPHSFMVQEFIKKAVDRGCEYIVLEVTSHSLDQGRFWGVKFKIGVITNITHEHLDYHKTMNNYLEAKAKLLRGVEVAVLNHDDANFKKLLKFTRGKKVFTFGNDKRADFYPGKYPLKLKVLGDYNVSNAMAAIAAASSLGIDARIAIKSLEDFRGLSGRMEEIKNNLGFKIFIDFAHTPNGLEQALSALRGRDRGKLIAVFGCAGARDVEKRPMMGAVASRLADIVVLTDEDPRFEDPQKIITQIVAGMESRKMVNNKTLFIESDRTKAIALAIKLAGKGDVVGIFGKGHEKSMSYRGVEKPWSDQEAARKACLLLYHGR